MQAWGQKDFKSDEANDKLRENMGGVSLRKDLLKKTLKARF
jgi:hypothetical protein